MTKDELNALGRIEYLSLVYRDYVSELEKIVSKALYYLDGEENKIIEDNFKAALETFAERLGKSNDVKKELM